ncbi:hypothetical protein Q31b_32110 [Novipirellula aureliae]|uniref:Uncharacterized protein n=1 Tax=Novipirellula aureliae TaxID=2527966 RepID=A0A5C6DUB9_9BACT|nr:hypothetical protein [Novipirellula aureliae]TWU39895.1 hypothetical protein Q31b_32110 [Novipirellula aureliae]
MKYTTQILTTTIALAFLIGTTGCTSVTDKKPTKSFSERMFWNKKKEEIPEPYPNPVKMAVTWTPDTLMQTGRTATRGFGGRIFFYDERSRPVPVEGTLIVHGFDENNPNPEAAVKRYEFTPEQFTRHFSTTDLGASYSVWIPWDAVGGEPRRISLVASFKPVAPQAEELKADGKTPELPKLVQGIPAMVMLPGVKSELNQVAESQDYLSPQFKAYQQASTGVNTRTSGLTTTTIKRRRTSQNGRDQIPSIQFPNGFEHGNQTQIAANESTPSHEILMAPSTAQPRGQSSSTVLPASATQPIR